MQQQCLGITKRKCDGEYNHSAGPWALNIFDRGWNGNHIVECESNFPGINGTVALVSYAPNARRIVACVNACEGFKTDFIEKIRFDTVVMRSQAAMVKALFRAEAFIAGFEGDETQEGVDQLLGFIRHAIGGAA